MNEYDYANWPEFVDLERLFIASFQCGVTNECDHHEAENCDSCEAENEARFEEEMVE